MIKITRQERKNLLCLFSDFYQRASEARTGAVRVALWLRVWSALDTTLDPDFFADRRRTGRGTQSQSWVQSMGHPSRFVSTQQRRDIYWNIYFQHHPTLWLQGKREKLRQVLMKIFVFCLTTIYFQFLLSARAEWAGRGLEAGGRGRPLGSGRGLTLVTSGYDRIGSWSLLLILLFSTANVGAHVWVKNLQQVFILPTTATEEASWWRNICAFISLYTHLLLQFTLPAGDQVGRGGGLPSWAGGNDIYHHHDHHEHFTTAGRCG